MKHANGNLSKKQIQRIQREANAWSVSEVLCKQRELREARDHGFDTIEEYQDYLEKMIESDDISYGDLMSMEESLEAF
jgi:hypothetical protein